MQVPNDIRNLPKRCASMLRHLDVRQLLKRVGIAVVMGMVSVTCLIVYASIGLPSIDTLEDYKPPQATLLYSDDGHLVGELFTERRRLIPTGDIPEHVKRAFLAAEDAGFYQHQGLDYIGIMRAAIKNLRPGSRRQGASTITQQLVKTMIIGSERSYMRKLREAILSRQLEGSLTKDEILYIYINQIWYGHNAYGIEQAAQTYFGRSVRDVTLEQAGYLAAIPKHPMHYNLITDPLAAKRRQVYVLNQMAHHHWADLDEIQMAIDAPIPQPAAQPPFLGKLPHYVEHVRRQLIDLYGEDTVYRGGLTVYIGMRANQQAAAQQALRTGLQNAAKKQGYEGAAYRIEVHLYERFVQSLHTFFDGEVTKQNVYATATTPREAWGWDLAHAGKQSVHDHHKLQKAMALVPLRVDAHITGIVSHIDSVQDQAYVDLGSAYGRIMLDDVQWARRFAPTEPTRPPRDISQVFNRGDLVTIKLGEREDFTYQHHPVYSAQLVPRPKIEGALVAIDPYTRYVTALVGGYQQKPGGLIRATQSKRQPGSAFKPILYATALAKQIITPASLCPDSPVVFHDPWTGKSWKPQNDNGKYDGSITYRTALARSKNTCSVKLIEKVTPRAVIEQARSMGIASDLPENLTLALGTCDITPLELANAYACIASGGLYAPPIFVRKVVDPSGEILMDHRSEPTEVLKPDVAFVVTSMMQSVIERGTGQRAKVLKRPLAGKTGTSQQARNAWFSGFSPELVATVWTGFDDNKSLGRVSGSSIALPIWIQFMEAALAATPPSDFEPPGDVQFSTVHRLTGAPLTDPGHPMALREAFVWGTEPNEAKAQLQDPFLIEESTETY